MPSALTTVATPAYFSSLAEDQAPRSPDVKVSRKAVAPVTVTGVKGWTLASAAVAPVSSAPSATAPVATVISFMIVCVRVSAGTCHVL